MWWYDYDDEKEEEEEDEEEEGEKKRCHHQDSKFNLCKKIVETWPDVSECLLIPSSIPAASSRYWACKAHTCALSVRA